MRRANYVMHYILVFGEHALGRARQDTKKERINDAGFDGVMAARRVLCMHMAKVCVHNLFELWISQSRKVYSKTSVRSNCRMEYVDSCLF